MIEHKKNTTYYLAFPAIDSTTPSKYKSGITPVATAFSQDGTGAWAALTIADTVTEIGTTGVYEITISAAEMNHDKVIIKFSASGMADDAYEFDLRTKLVPDLNDIAATAIVSGGAIATTGGAVDTVTVVTNDVGITQTGADKVWSSVARTLTDKLGFELSASGVRAIWDALTTSLTTVGSVGKQIVDNLDTTVSSRMPTSHINATLGSVDTVATVTDGAKASTALLNTVWTDAKAAFIDVAISSRNSVIPDPAGTAPTAVEVRQEIDTNSTQLAKLGVPANGSMSADIGNINSQLPPNLANLGVSASGIVDANVKEVISDAQSATDLKDFVDQGYDPLTNKIQGVALVDTTSTVTDGAKASTAVSNTVLTSTRIGYLDNLSAGAVAQEDSITSLQGDVTAIKGGTIEKNTAGSILVLMLDSTGTPVVGAAVTGKTKIDNAVPVAMSATISVTDAYGYCQVAYTAADVNGTDSVAFILSAPGANDSHLTLQLT